MLRVASLHVASSCLLGHCFWGGLAPLYPAVGPVGVGLRERLSRPQAPTAGLIDGFCRVRAHAAEAGLSTFPALIGTSKSIRWDIISELREVGISDRRNLEGSGVGDGGFRRWGQK